MPQNLTRGPLRAGYARAGLLLLLPALGFFPLLSGTVAAEDGAASGTVSTAEGPPVLAGHGLEGRSRSEGRAALSPSGRARTEAQAPALPLLLSSSAEAWAGAGTTRTFQGVSLPLRGHSSTIALASIPLPVEDLELAPQRRLLKPPEFLRGSPGEGLEDLELSETSPLEIEGEGDGPGFLLHRDLLEGPAQKRNPRLHALTKLASRIVFRHLRHQGRSELRKQYQEDPSFRFSEYIRRREEIARLGRGDRDPQTFGLVERVEEIRKEVLGEEADEVEPSYDLLRWGPLRIDDGGGLGFDVSWLRGGSSRDFELEVAAEEQSTGDSLFSGERCRFGSDLRFHPDLSSLSQGESGRDAFGKVSAALSVDFLTPILERRYLTTELEGSFNPDGSVGVFFNIILYTR
ncbi:MAG: hypothetical protein ACE5GW_02550 [Planctomycetota bacterium]